MIETALLKFLPWDSAFFGKRIGQVLPFLSNKMSFARRSPMQAALAWFRQRGVSRLWSLEDGTLALRDCMSRAAS